MGGNVKRREFLVMVVAAGVALWQVWRAIEDGFVADTGTGCSANTWHHAAGVFVSSTDRTVCIDEVGYIP